MQEILCDANPTIDIHAKPNEYPLCQAYSIKEKKSPKRADIFRLFVIVDIISLAIIVKVSVKLSVTYSQFNSSTVWENFKVHVFSLSVLILKHDILKL